jgi:predicted permease
LILAVGIAAATITFSVVDTVVLRPLPFERADQLVTISGVARAVPEQLRALREDVPGFDSVARVTVLQTLPITAGGVTDDLSVSHAPADLFRVLRLKPLIGQLWTSDDELRGDTQVAVIGHALWQRRFAGDPSVLGRTLQVLDVPYRIVAVMPPGADFEELGWSVQLWVPGLPDNVREARSFSGAVLGRLRPGVSLAQVNEQIKRAVVPVSPATNPDAQAPRPPAAAPWLDSYVQRVRSWMLLALGVVGLVVFIACVNAANVMLTRSTQRAHDLAVRASLGASRRTLAISMLAESLMLSIGAGLIALLFSIWGIGVARTMMPRGIFRAASISLDGRVFIAALTAAIVTGLLCGAVPAWQASKASVVTLLKDASTAVTRGRRTWRSAFLVVEIACIAALLVVCTLFIASFVRVVSIDLGFDRSKLLAVATVTNYQGTVDEIQQRLAQVPGVTGVAAVVSSSLPLINSFGGARAQTKLRADGAAAGVAPLTVEYYRVTPNYFDVAGTPFQRGSTWSSSVASSDWHPMVIDAAAARNLFGERDPVGLRVLAEGDLKDVFTIVGVVPYAYTNGPELTTRSSVYVPMRPNAKPSWISFLLRTSPPPAALVRDVEGVMASIAPTDPSPGAGVRAIDDGYQRLTAVRRFNATLMSAFALVAVLIGAAGIYAVTASVVAQQTREIGVRVALGATAGHIRRSVLNQAARHVLLGLAIGLPAAWWISRGFGALFFQVGPSDPSIYLIVSVVIGAVAILAALVPARRASRVNPIVSLRNS